MVRSVILPPPPLIQYKEGIIIINNSNINFFTYCYIFVLYSIENNLYYCLTFIYLNCYILPIWKKDGNHKYLILAAITCTFKTIRFHRKIYWNSDKIMKFIFSPYFSDCLHYTKIGQILVLYVMSSTQTL